MSRVNFQFVIDETRTDQKSEKAMTAINGASAQLVSCRKLGPAE